MAGLEHDRQPFAVVEDEFAGLADGQAGRAGGHGEQPGERDVLWQFLEAERGCLDQVQRRAPDSV
jgi:hypothetical protein